MTLLNKCTQLVSWAKSSITDSTGNTYILVDCDTYSEAFNRAVEMARDKDNIFVHGYGINQIDFPDGAVQGHDIGSYKGNMYDITTSNPGYKALFRRIKQDKQDSDKNMTAYHQLYYALVIISGVFPDATCVVLSKDNYIIEHVSHSVYDLDGFDVRVSSNITDIEEAMPHN